MTSTHGRLDPRLNNHGIAIDLLIAQASHEAAEQIGATYTERLRRAMSKLGLTVHEPL